jgi:hypothetical protein
MPRESEPAPERILPTTILTERLTASQVEKTPYQSAVSPSLHYTALKGKLYAAARDEDTPGRVSAK